MSSSLKSLYLLDPAVTYLNHGSFGACPKPVFEKYQHWQLEMERQPVEFIGRRSHDLMAEARTKLGAYVGAHPDDLVYFPNSTTAMNMVVRSLKLNPGDEILATDQEYPAMNQTWNFIAHQTGAKYKTHPVSLPFTTQEDFINAFWAGVNERTKVIFISHIPFSLGVILPVAEICRRAHQSGKICIVDGAHAPGQIRVDMNAIGADIYFGACHKWLSAPKGSSFLYASKQAQEWLEPLVISHGWGQQPPANNSDTIFIDHQEYQGTRDISAFLSVPTAIDFQRQHNWPVHQERCHELARSTRETINGITGYASLYPDSVDWFNQLVTVRMPDVDLTALTQKLYSEYRIEVPVLKWNNNPPVMRISFQAYNSQEDADILISALTDILPELIDHSQHISAV